MITLFNNHPYISSSGTPVGCTKFTATYNVGMVVEWCGHWWVHITVWMACLVFILCQPVHSLNHPYRFLFRNLFMKTNCNLYFHCQPVIIQSLIIMLHFPIITESVVLYNSARYYGSWNYTEKYYYSCSYSSTSLTGCNKYFNSWWCNSGHQVGLWCMTQPQTGKYMNVLNEWMHACMHDFLSILKLLVGVLK